jgi:hypothetical protein
MLNEHLNVIYIIEELNLSKLKSQAKKLGDAAASGNILKVNQIFDTIPSISIDQLKLVARKKFNREYKESEKDININLKKAPDKIKDMMILIRSSLLNIKAKAKDPELQLKISKILEEMKKLYNKVEVGMTVDGITLLAVAAIIKFLFGAILIVPLLQITGVFFIAIAVFALVMGTIVKMFIEAKKAGQRFIS